MRDMHFSAASWFLLIGLLLWAIACQESDIPNRAARGPIDATFNRTRAVQLADSLHALVPPETFIARFSGDPFNQKRADALTTAGFQGRATYEVTQASGEDPMAVRFSFEGSNRHALRLDWTTDVLQAEVETPPLSSDHLLTIEQQRESRYPTVQAVLRKGRERFVSRSGYLKLDEVDGPRIRGSFYFEMRARHDTPQGGWFELVGAFDAVEAH